MGSEAFTRFRCNRCPRATTVTGLEMEAPLPDGWIAFETSGFDCVDDFDSDAPVLMCGTCFEAFGKWLAEGKRRKKAAKR
jgi:hypothetical protein